MNRKLDLLNVFESDSLPTAEDAINPEDTPNFGQTEKLYTQKNNIGGVKASVSALKALSSSATDRIDNQLYFVIGKGYYYWDDDLTTAGDDDTVVTPNDITEPAPGRWVLETAVGGGGGGNGSASNLELLMQKTESEKFGYGIRTIELDHSASLSGKIVPFHKAFTATLLQGYGSSDTTIDVVWNALAVNDSDKNYDSATGWTATGQAANLAASTTAGDFKVGTAGLKFDKNGSGTEAAIRFDRSTQTFAVGANTRVYAMVKLPSTTNLSNILLRMYADSTSNFRTFTATAQYDNTAFAVGWNLIFWDISTGGSAGGSGWTYGQLSRYQEVGVTTATSGQTYTGIILDSLYYSYRYPEDIGAPGTEWTIFDNSNKNNVRFDNSNTRYDGRLTLVASIGDSFAGGLSGTSRGQIKRTTLAIVGDGFIPFDNDSNLSGEITLEQDFRIETFGRESVSGDWSTFVDIMAAQAYKVTTVGGSTIGVDDAADQHLNLLNGDTMDIFRPMKIGGKVKYRLIASRALTANSSASGGTTTLTLTTTSIQVGDVVCKRHLTQLAVSVVDETADENFSAATLLDDPDGVQLIDAGATYPRIASITGHWRLGGTSNAEGTLLRKGTVTDLALVGTPNLQGQGLAGYAALTGCSSSNYLQIAAADTANLDIVGGSKNLLFSLWWYRDSATVGQESALFSKTNNSSNGYSIFHNTSNQLAVFNHVGASQTIYTFSSTGWFHIAGMIVDGTHRYWVNGVEANSFSYGINPNSTNNVFKIGAASGFATQGNTRFMDALFIGGAVSSAWTQTEIDSIYNGGNFRPLGFAAIQRFLHKATAQAGQKESIRGRLTRSTIAVTPTIYQAGFIKTA